VRNCEAAAKFAGDNQSPPLAINPESSIAIQLIRFFAAYRISNFTSGQLSDA
jgi:hypothetical protein